MQWDQKMARLLLILFSPPTEAQNISTLCELSKATIAAKHEVTIFLDAEATYSILARQILPDKATSASRIAELIGMGAQVLVCRESARIRGIDTKKDFIDGVVESSLGGLTELMEQHDRIVAFG